MSWEKSRIFEFDNQGLLVSTVQAEQGRIEGHGTWTLNNAVRREFDVAGQLSARIVRSQHESFAWPSAISAEMVSVALLKPDRMRTTDLYAYVQHLEANGQTAQRYEIEFWRKVFYPLSCLVMVVLSLPFAYLHFRSGGITGYVFGGVMIGISFFLLNNVFGYIGNLNHWRPWLAAASPAHHLFVPLAGCVWLAGAQEIAMLGVIVFAHGSRDLLWRAPVESVARQIRDADPAVRVACAYLELSEPDLPTAAAQLVSQGVSRIRVLPLFFGMGKHAREDLPVLVEQLGTRPPRRSLRAPRRRRRRSPPDRPARTDCAGTCPMNLHQFRFVQEAVRRNLNLTEAAKALHTSQPGVSKAIIELEEELGIEIFARHGKRIKRITEPGVQVLKSIEVILREVNNLKRIGEQYAAQDSGTLSIATTHTQARYVLPGPVAKLRQAYPKVAVSLHQGSPDQVAKMLIEEVAEIGVATESLTNYPDLVTLPCYEWQHVLVFPYDHPLVAQERITLEDLAHVPLITYHPSFTGRTRIDQAFALRHLRPNIVLEAIDSDVIKTYVKLGMGVGIVARDGDAG